MARQSKPFFERVLREGMLLTIRGKMRAGKSNLASYLIEKAVEKGYYVYTNIHFFPKDRIKEAIEKKKLLRGVIYHAKPIEIKTVTTCSQLLKGLLSTTPNITILDETALFAASTMGPAKKVRWIKALTFTIGKLDSSMVLIWQAKKSVIPALRQELVSYEIKVIRRGSTRFAEIYYMPEESEEEEVEPIKVHTWKNLKPTAIPFDSKGLVKFEFDIDIEDFFNRIANYNSLEVTERALEIIEEMLRENREKEEKVKKVSVRSLLIDVFQAEPNIEYIDAKEKFREKGITLKRDYFYRIRSELGIKT